MFYYRDLKEWSRLPGTLSATCLTAPDYYEAVLDYFEIRY